MVASAVASLSRPVRAVVFDLDGLLVDSEPLWRRAEIEEFARVGLALSDDDCRQTMGLRIDAAVAHWWARSPWGDTGVGQAEVAARVTARVAELVAAEGAPMPGALEVVEGCVERGLAVGVCSGSFGVIVEAALERLGIAGAVDVWHSAEAEELGKPHPACYLTTAARLGVDPMACVAFEDAVNGMIAAKAARMRVVVVPEPGARGAAVWGAADARRATLDGFAFTWDDGTPWVLDPVRASAARRPS